MSDYDYDLIVLGAGPGGYVAAIRASQLGFKTAVVEREGLGGVCMNWGCIPTKALIYCADVLDTLNDAESLGFTFENLKVNYSVAVERSRSISERQGKGVAFLMKKNKIDVIDGQGEFVDAHTLKITPSEYMPDVEEKTVSAANFVIATGARAKTLPGMEFDGEQVIDYRTAVTMDEIPEKMVVVGSGAIGMEFAHVYNSYGSDVTVIEMLPQVLPLEDKEVSDEMAKAIRKQGIKAMVNTRTESIEKFDDHVEVTVKNLDDDSTEVISTDKVLMAIGVTPNTEGIGLENAGLTPSKQGFVEVDEYLRTKVPHIYAVGDCTGKRMLAHVASAQAIVAAEAMAGEETVPFPDERYDFMPRCTYCSPEVASLGLTEEQAKEKGYEIKVGKFPFMPNGKARAYGAREGFIKLISDAKYGEILGAHLVGPEVTELLPELSLAQFMEITPAEIARTVHAHPTFNEVIMEAAHAIEGHSIHM